ncbi:3-isopropylmalate dehydratase small subunit [Futiania mangrovi]|uniref:3-isopropylmalate dehydratase small subunit n=1 Tax=Futiania mangrovi TaxID=2959716 RepID=A0A9J6PK89_9PROT|nr:3-isopropylmalate dehydratase small subunit [Futiania mangrovii]MCP1336975.1 3-isopropylmalate dehydratase small subunit [Futiania mangrovii]
MGALEKTRKVKGVAAPLPRANIDTDAIIPIRHLITVSREGLGKGLFSGWRLDAQDREVPDFVLNRPAFRNAKILIAGENFGCGSSREHAVWSLVDYGIRAVIAPSFASIFYENCKKNGLAAVVLPDEAVRALTDAAEAHAGRDTLIDIEGCTVTGPDGSLYPFEMEADRREALLQGLDEIGMTLRHAEAIAAFQARDSKLRPWIYEVPAV